jgi:hypothetical protein
MVRSGERERERERERDRERLIRNNVGGSVARRESLRKKVLFIGIF